MKYEDLKKVNAEIKTTDIKGKEYAEVNQRIKAFKMLYPEGFIKTDIIKILDGICIIRAEVGFYREDNTMHILGEGTAYEKEGSTFINRTSYIENCETSAVGRALGMAGFGIDVSVASAEEVTNAINNQKPKKASAAQIKTIKELYGEQLPTLLDHLGIKDIKEMTGDMAGKVLRKVKENEKK